MSYDASFAEHPVLYRTLEHYARSVQPSVYLEIGVREGDSLRSVLGASTPEQLILADNWSSEYGGSGRLTHGHIWKVLAEASYPGHVTFLDGPSQETLAKYFWGNGIPYRLVDMALVDGDHSLEGAVKDFWHVWPLMRVGGLMLADDIVHPQHRYLQGAFREFLEEQGGTLVDEDISDGVGIAVGMKV